MKLTKGKITKLYGKKKQTRKKKKKRNTSNKNKTFRGRRSLNLANKTLRRYKKGGALDDDDGRLESPKTSNVEDTTVTNPTQDNTTSPVEDKTTSPVEDTTTSPVEDKTTSPVEDTTTSPVEDTTTSPVDNSMMPLEETPPPIAGTPQVDAYPVTDATTSNEENIENKKIADAVKTLAKTLDTGIVIPQDGFQSNTIASEKLVSGGKKRGKFKLTKRSRIKTANTE